MTRKKITLATIACALLLSACKTDDAIGLKDTNGYVTSSEVTLTPSEVSIFDQGNTDYTLFSTVALVNKLDINGETATVTDKKATFTADFKKLGLSKTGDVAELDIIPFIDATALDTVKASISVFNPIKISTYVQSSKQKDSLITKLNIVKDSTCKVAFQITPPKSGKVENVTVERKVSKDGTYVNLGSSFNIEKDSVTFKPSEFKKLDTLYYKVTAKTSESVVVSEEAVVFIDTDYFGTASTSNVAVSNTYYSFPEFEKSNSENADIEIVDSGNPSDLSIVAKNPNITFVIYKNGTEAKDFMNTGDKLEAIKIFSETTPVNQIKPIRLEDVIIYRKVIKEDGQPDVNTYGLLFIDALNSNPEYTINISTKS